MAEQVFDFSKVLVFGGTTEGRILSDELNNRGNLALVCVATEYGETFLKDQSKVRVGRLDEEGMLTLFSEQKPTLVVDATHPYAVDVTINIKAACNRAGTHYLRIKRGEAFTSDSLAEDIYRFSNLPDMIAWLKREPGTILSTLGVKEARSLTEIDDYKDRVYIRVLPTKESLALCDEAGFPKENVIAKMGPFSYEENLRDIDDSGAAVLLTKDSGRAGGFEEKLKAARERGLKIAVLVRPLEEEGAMELDRVLDWIKND